MIRITLLELIASTIPQKGVNELAMKIGQIRKWTSREMDQSLEEEHFVAKNPVKKFRNYSRKSGTDKKFLQKRVQTIRKVRILVENAMAGFRANSEIIGKFRKLKKFYNHFVKRQQ